MKSLILISLFFIVSCTNSKQEPNSISQTRSNTVTRIADGDTFVVLHADKSQEKIRLYGVDAPEQGQDFGTAAKNALSDLVFGKEVRIERKSKDKYKRTLAIVYTGDGKCVNEELLRQGMVWHFKRFDRNPKWAALEEMARNNKTGLWSKADAVEPSLFRDSR